MIEKLVSTLWGNLKGDEARKFFYLSVGAFFLVGAQWPIRVLRDSIFINTVGSAFQPNVKMLSLVICLPITLIYTALVTWVSREKTLYVISGMLSLVGSFFAVLIFMWSRGSIVDATMLGWGFYIFSEAFDVMTVAPYWAFINDITYPGEAKRGYGLVVFASQLGGFFFTGAGNAFTRTCGSYLGKMSVVALIASLLLPFFAFFVWKTMHTVRRQNLVGYMTLEEAEEGVRTYERTGFMSGIRLLFSKPYVGGIFAITASREIIATLTSYRLYRAVEIGYTDAAVRHLFFFNYSLVTQFIAVLFALFGTSFIQRKFGIRFSLMAYPIFLAFCAFVATIMCNSVLIVAAVVAASKALHYTLNKPAREVLYIPTSTDVKYKSKAWIEAFGIRSAKMVGSALNKTVTSVPALGGIIFGVAGTWVFIAGAVGYVYHSIVKDRERIG
ncbi:NTP/NDP exchange transporter [Candidatus Dependentiae bacterium]